MESDGKGRTPTERCDGVVPSDPVGDDTRALKRPMVMARDNTVSDAQGEAAVISMNDWPDPVRVDARRRGGGHG